MGRAILLLIAVLSGLAAPSWATQPVSVAQLDRWLAKAGRKSDEKLADGLGNLELTERASAAQVARWQAGLPGSKSREALTVLVDVARFLPPPQAAMLADAAPDPKTQGAILSSAIDYVVNSLSKLPNFYATRMTERFYTWANEVPYQPLHKTGQSSVHVTYQDGAEVRGSVPMDSSQLDLAQTGFTTAGEFGPILTVVLHDAMHGAISFGYWERSAQGKAAVFRYSVPQAQSNYIVAIRRNGAVEKLIPAYHGEIAMDPSSGAILRISILSDTTSEDIKASEMEVEYGTVALGGKDYLCPVRSGALLQSRQKLRGMLTELNEVSFSGYHLFRGDVRMAPTQ